MNISKLLLGPISTFEVDVPANTYYDFELEPWSTYPLVGVTYPVDYGNIPGYTGEDGQELDFYVGEDEAGLLGFIVVYRGDSIPDEHKFYVGLTDDDLQKILAELKPVLIQHKALTDMTTLLDMIEVYKDE